MEEMYSYGALTKEWLEEKEGKIYIETTNVLGGKRKHEYKYDITLKNKKGKIMWSGKFTTVGCALEELEKWLVEKEQKVKPTPYAKLVHAVESITEENFYNNEEAGSLSNKATFNGWDVTRYEDDDIVVKVHNAANPVIAFNAYQEGYLVRVNLVNLKTYGQEAEVFPKILEAVDNYLYSSVESRKAELGIEGDKKEEAVAVEGAGAEEAMGRIAGLLDDYTYNNGVVGEQEVIWELGNILGRYYGDKEGN